MNYFVDKCPLNVSCSVSEYFLSVHLVFCLLSTNAPVPTNSLYAPDAPTHRQSAKDKACAKPSLQTTTVRVIRQDKEGEGGEEGRGINMNPEISMHMSKGVIKKLSGGLS